MDKAGVILPVIVLVMLTFFLMIGMGRARVHAIRAKKVRMVEVALDGAAWPDNVKQWSNSFMNQFQLPVLFYVLCSFIILTKHDSVLMLALAWAFVCTRLLHALIHITSNRVVFRFYAYLAGSLILVSMWVLFVVQQVGPMIAAGGL